jgi:pimeloyl-ACP methyl ester carboxylesterase
MIRNSNAAAAGAMLAATIFLMSCVSGDTDLATARARPPGAASNTAKPEQIYLLRGIGGVFSLGMDRLARKLRERGIAVSVIQHTSWRRAARQIEEAYKADLNSRPVVLVGHSLGAQAVAPLARNLAKSDIPVDFLAAIDPVTELTIPNNVILAWHVRVSAPAAKGLVKANTGFKGKIVDFNVGERESLKNTGINHWNIDQSEGVQDELVKQIVSEVHARRRL